MSQPLASLQSLLLDLLSPDREVGQQELDALGPDEWRTIHAMARQHRLEPLFYWQLDRHKPQLSLPDDIRSSCVLAFERSTVRALKIQREVQLVHRLLDDVGIPYLLLKGAYLAFHAYPHPGLRPMRDLDILVPRARAREAFNALLAQGAVRSDSGHGHPETAHHLPPLRSPFGAIRIELHPRLFHLKGPHEGQSELSDDPSFWQRTIERKVAEVAVRFASPTDLLLHLIVHSVHDHQFDNGPLVLSDMAFLLQGDEIDWPFFWKLAGSTGHRRGALLALRLMERYWGASHVVWPAGPAEASKFDGDVLDIAARLMLRDFKARQEASLAMRMDGRASLSGRMAFLAGKLFPSRRSLAAEHGAEPDSLRLYLLYPRKWWRVATTRLPKYLTSLRKSQFRKEVEDLRSLNDWLYR